MPHQCTTCDRTFPDGSKAMLGGCPDCGGNKFQFLPSGVERQSDDDPVEPTTVSSNTAPSPDRSKLSDSREDVAQASARRTVVSREELPPVDDRAAILEDIAADARPAEREPPLVEDPDGAPDLETLRKELNDQFESIKIVEPGEYELNLMELYDRKEYIIALEEDGRYVIEVPTGLDERTPGD